MGKAQYTWGAQCTLNKHGNPRRRMGRWAHQRDKVPEEWRRVWMDRIPTNCGALCVGRLNFRQVLSIFYPVPLLSYQGEPGVWLKLTILAIQVRLAETTLKASGTESTSRLLTLPHKTWKPRWHGLRYLPWQLNTIVSPSCSQGSSRKFHANGRDHRTQRDLFRLWRLGIWHAGVRSGAVDGLHHPASHLRFFTTNPGTILMSLISLSSRSRPKPRNYRRSASTARTTLRDITLHSSLATPTHSHRLVPSTTLESEPNPNLT